MTCSAPRFTSLLFSLLSHGTHPYACCVQQVDAKRNITQYATMSTPSGVEIYKSMCTQTTTKVCGDTPFGLTLVSGHVYRGFDRGGDCCLQGQHAAPLHQVLPTHLPELHRLQHPLTPPQARHERSQPAQSARCTQQQR